jgi:hypothetical protein
VVREQVVTPVEHRVQGLMPRHRCTAAVPEQLETIVEQLRGPANPMGADATSRELNGERDSIKPMANPCDDRRIGIVQLGTIATRRGPLHEKLRGRMSKRFRGGEACILRRTIERVQ